MNIDSLIVHPIDRSIVYRPHETIELKGPLITKPRVLTGGGDNLDAGLCGSVVEIHDPSMYVAGHGRVRSLYLRTVLVRIGKISTSLTCG